MKFKRLSLSVPDEIHRLLRKEVKKQKKTRNVTISSFIVELLSQNLIK